MWLLLISIAAIFFAIYSVASKAALKNNSVFWSLLISIGLSAIFLSPFHAPAPLSCHLRLILKSVFVTVSCYTGYYALKGLPITIISTIKAASPLIVVILSIVLYGEILNIPQYIGIALIITALFFLGHSSEKEGIHLLRNKSFHYLLLSLVLGTFATIYDKRILQFMEPLFAVSYSQLYISIILLIVLLLTRMSKNQTLPRLKWDWWLVVVAVANTLAEVFYLSSLSQDGALLSVVSMIKKASIPICFILGAILFKEKNIRSKAIELVIMMIGIFLLLYSSK